MLGEQAVAGRRQRHSLRSIVRAMRYPVSEAPWWHRSAFIWGNMWLHVVAQEHTACDEPLTCAPSTKHCRWDHPSHVHWQTEELYELIHRRGPTS